MTKRVASLALALLCGLVFGIGLLLSTMTQPSKVIGFLDVTGRWDPTLAFVMAGAVGVYALALRWIAQRTPWLGGELQRPARGDFDIPLVAGSAIFGIGWGLSGFCPGPAIVAAGSGAPTALVFVATMLVGTVVGGLLDRR